jgi:hypothetical protein
LIAGIGFSVFVNPVRRESRRSPVRFPPV